MSILPPFHRKNYFPFPSIPLEGELRTGNNVVGKVPPIYITTPSRKVPVVRSIRIIEDDEWSPYNGNKDKEGNRCRRF